MTSSMKRGRGTRKVAADRAAEIEHAAKQLALRSGLRALTMRAVAAELGVSPALVLHHVHSMDRLVAHVFAEIVAEELHDVEAEVATAVPAGRLHALLPLVLAQQRSRVTKIWVEAWALGAEQPLLSEQVRMQMDDWRGFVASLISAGVSAGLYVTQDVDAVAGQLLAMVDGLNAHSLVGWQNESRLVLLRQATAAMLGSEFSEDFN